jgi:hypothetical protein
MKWIFTVAFTAAMITNSFFLAGGDAETKTVTTAPVLVTQQEIDAMSERFSEVEVLMRFIGEKKSTEVETKSASIEGTINNLDEQIREMLEDIPDTQMKINDMSGYIARLFSDLSLVEPVAGALERESREFVEKVSGLDAAMADLRTETVDFETLNASYQEFFDYVAVVPDEINGLKGPHVLFTGANVHIRSHRDNTEDCSSGSGNLIIGYNESLTDKPRTGVHNVIVGPGHSYTACGGFVAGLANTAGGSWASVSGGLANTASGGMSSVSGGAGNAARGWASSVRGGLELDAGDDYGHIPGRQQESADARVGL